MHQIRVSPSYGKLLLAGFIVAVFAAAPVGITDDFSVDTSAAFAKNGNGGGNGGGRGGGSGSDSANAENGPGKSSSAPGHNKSEVATSEEDSGKKGLGSLSASNASATARAHAAPNSQVGKMDAYEKAIAAGDLEAAAAALGDAANKEITPEVVAQVNRNMGIESTPEVEAEVAALAEAARTAAPAEEEAEGEGEDVAGEDGSGDSGDVEEGEIASAAEDLIDGSDTATQ